MGIRYSDIVGDLFYKISLSVSDRELCDIHFTAAAHHHQLSKRVNSGHNFTFHNERFLAHLLKMKAVIYLNGSFENATDASQKGLNNRQSWHPKNLALPAKDMFDDMAPDAEYPIGQPHISDQYLDISVLNYIRKLASRENRMEFEFAMALNIKTSRIIQ